LQRNGLRRCDIIGEKGVRAHAAGTDAVLPVGCGGPVCIRRDASPRPVGKLTDRPVSQHLTGVRRIHFARIMRVVGQHQLATATVIVTQTVEGTRHGQFFKATVAFRVRLRIRIGGDERRRHGMRQRIPLHERQQRGKLHDGGAAVEAFARQRDRAVMGETRCGVEQGRLRQQRRDAARIQRASERDQITVHHAHRTPVLAHAAEIPTGIPRIYTHDVNQRLHAGRISQQPQDMRIDQPSRRTVRTGIRRAQHRQRDNGVGQHRVQRVIGIGQTCDGLLNHAGRERKVVRVVGVGRSDDARIDQMRLQRRHVHRAHGDTGLNGQCRGAAGRIALVLHIALHAQQRHGVAVRADTETCHQQAVQRLGQQCAERQVRRQIDRPRISDEKQIVNREAVRIKIADRPHDRVGPRAVVQDIDRRDRHRAHQTPPFARCRILSGIPGRRRHAFACAPREKEDVRHIGVTHETDIAVDIAVTQHMPSPARTLHGRLTARDKFSLSAGSRSHIGVAGRIDHRLRADNAAKAVRQYNHHAFHRVAVHHRPVRERSVKHTRTCGAACLPVPLRLGRVQRGAGRLPAGIHIAHRETARITMIVRADTAVGLHTAHRVEHIQHQRDGAGAAGADRGGRARRACPHHQDLALSQNRQRPRTFRHRAQRVRQRRRQARQHFANLFRRGHGSGIRRQRDAGERRTGQSLDGCCRTDTVGQGHLTGRILEVGREGAREIGPHAEHIEMRHALRPERIQIQSGRAGPGCGLLGRDTDDAVRRQPRETVRLIQAGLGPRQITCGLLDLQKFQHAARVHVRVERAAVDATVHTRRHA